MKLSDLPEVLKLVEQRESMERGIAAIDSQVGTWVGAVQLVLVDRHAEMKRVQVHDSAELRAVLRSFLATELVRLSVDLAAKGLEVE